MLKIISNGLNEVLSLNKVQSDEFGHKRIVVTSVEPKKFSDEIWRTHAIFRKYGGAFDKKAKTYFWNDRFTSIDKQLEKANKAVAEANKFLQFSSSENVYFESYEDIEDLEVIKEFLEDVKEAASEIVGKQKATDKILSDYIDKLIQSVEDGTVLDTIKEFHKKRAEFRTRTGQWNYSISNQFLIMIQIMRTGASIVGSEDYWFGRGYRPKPDAKKIYIIRANTMPLYKKIYFVLKDNPNYAQIFWKDLKLPKFPPKKKDGDVFIPKEYHQAFFTWATKNGYMSETSSFQFSDTFIYDDLNVEPIPNKEQIDPPASDWWYSSSVDEDSRTTIILDALKKFTEEYSIRVTQDSEGKARGYSAGEHISLHTDSAGAGLLSTFIHEIVHEILHQSSNIKKFPAYSLANLLGELTSEDKELHAEAVTYVVMSRFDYDVKHSTFYLASWKADRDKITKYHKIILRTSALLIDYIVKYAEEVNGTSSPESDSDGLMEYNKIFKTLRNEVRKIIIDW